jgi:hypothetical protein
MLAVDRRDGVQAGPSVEGGRMLVRHGPTELTQETPPIRLSPTGSWLSLGLVHLDRVAGVSTADTADVYNTGTGEHVALDVRLDAPDDSTVAIPVRWLDDVTVQVLAAVGDRPWDDAPTAVHLTLHRCAVPAGTCQQAVDLGTVEPVADLLPVLPDGRGSANE